LTKVSVALLFTFASNYFKLQKTLVVVGGGAAGFFCAVNAASEGINVILLEKTGKLLSKVKVSGGGRCNVTHACFNISQMAAHYPRGERFLKKAFHHFFTADTIEWFKKRGVMLKKEADGRMFPTSDSSETIIHCLLQEASKKHVVIKMNAEVQQITPSGNGFDVALKNQQPLRADYVCVATGGYPKQEMYTWLHNIGHNVVAPVPSLFTFNLPGHPIRNLMGVVAEAQVKISGSKLSDSGPVLITHWGLSGPAILKLSAWGARMLAERQWHFHALINWCAATNEESLRQNFGAIRSEKAKHKLGSRNPFGLPARLWQFILTESGIKEDIRWADLPAKEQNRLIKNLTAYEIEVKGKTTFKEEFVTAGGIDLREIDANTMMSKKHPGLFFAGEALDIDGVTGGFNFQNAWTTGFIAAQNIKALAGNQGV
jgi:predicted Rossmann fold flavoprotein